SCWNGRGKPCSSSRATPARGARAGEDGSATASEPRPSQEREGSPPTIIGAVGDPASTPPSPSTQIRFYEDAYSQDPISAARYARWRALGAIGKAQHAIVLCAEAGIAPASTLDVGCGDGALLCELCRRGFGGRLSGVEIAEAAVAIARARPGIDSVDRFDGRNLAASDGAYDLGILSHVLEHVEEPETLLGEVARVSKAVLVEVPLE